MISLVPARNYLFKVSNLSKRITCESCLMSTLTIFNINDVIAVILAFLLLTVNIFSNFVLTGDFEQAKVCLVQIEETKNFINKLRLNLYHHNPTG